MGAGARSETSNDPIPEELLSYFVTLVGLQHLAPVLALLEPDEVLAVRQAALTKLRPDRVVAIRTALWRRINAIQVPPAASSPTRELRAKNGWLV